MLSLFGCSTGQKRFSANAIVAFDTVTNIVAYDVDQKSFEKKLKTLENLLARYDKLFDGYTEYKGINNIYALNRSAAESPQKAEREVIELLSYGKEVYRESGGRINICLGAVLELWHDARETALDSPENAYLPDMKSLKDAARHINPDDLIIDEESSTVFFKDSKLKLDVGAIAKGFAAQKIADELQESGVWQSFMLNLGGNVVTRGYKNGDGKTKWTIQIENPDPESDSALETLGLTDLAVVTSGDYQRYFEYDGKSYCHIINPETLMPAEYFSSVTVICSDSALADRLSTELFVMPLSDGKQLVESLEGVEAVWVDKEFNATYSSDFEQYKAL